MDGVAATNCEVTAKGTLLLSVAPGVVTWTEPVAAPAGTVAWISESETTVNVAAVPLKLTSVGAGEIVAENENGRADAA